MDGQDKQDYLARRFTRFTLLSSTIGYDSTRIPKTRSEAHGSPNFRTRSSSEPALPAAAFYPVNPEPFAKFARKRDLLSGRVVVPGKPMASQVQIPFEGVILQEHSAPISCPTPNFAKGSPVYPCSFWSFFVSLRRSSCPFVDIFLSFVPLRGLRADVSYHWREMRAIRTAGE